MAIYHLSGQVIKRSEGRSSVAAAAYRLGLSMVDDRTGERHDYTRKSGVDGWAQMTPDNAPAWMADPATCWNSVEAVEKRKDAQLCREFNIALPRELDDFEQKQLTCDWVRRNFVANGQAATIAFHHLDSDNPHAHIMVSMREINPDGWGKKARTWGERKDELGTLRRTWADTANTALEQAGCSERIDHRSLEAQGLDRQPTRHMGPKATAIERRGETPDRARIVMPTPAAMDHSQALAERQREQAKPQRQQTPQEAAQAAWQARATVLTELAQKGQQAAQVARERMEQRKREREAAEATHAATLADAKQHRHWQALAAAQAKEKYNSMAGWHAGHRIRSRLGWIPDEVKEAQATADAAKASEQRRKARAEKAEARAKKERDAAQEAAQAHTAAAADFGKVSGALGGVERQRNAHLEQSPQAQERRRQDRERERARQQREAEQAELYRHMIQQRQHQPEQAKPRRGYTYGQ